MERNKNIVDNAYIHYGMGKLFVHEIIDIDDTILSKIKSEIEQIELSLKDSNYSQRLFAKILSLSSYIEIIDPLGENNSESLSSKWYNAQWIGGNSPKNDNERLQQVFQYLGIAKALLSGKAKIVKYKKPFDKKRIMSNSVFNTREFEIQENFVFVLMPFSESWSDYIWRKQIKLTVEKIADYNLICKRADDLYGRDIMQDIYESLLTASVIIADMTNRNANVFYELGIAHTLGKDVILLAQSIDDIPFDLNRFRTCVYSNDGPGYEKLENFLAESIRDIFLKRQKE